jgi:starvation-inducible DNA-binding protein
MLKDTLKITLADAFTFYLKAQFYHWNVEGPDFVQYHDFLGDLYEDVQGSVDTIAELIRTLDEYAPGTLKRMQELTSITESDVIPNGLEMMRNLFTENLKLLATLMTAYKDATDAGEEGIANFLQDRIQAHEKHSWMLRSIIK